MTRWIDLHLHSTASDGAYSPARLMEMAHARGLSAVALTDHDTTAGLAAAAKRAAELGLEFIPGIELEAAHTGGVLHILGYFIDAGSPALSALAAHAASARAVRNNEILTKLSELGIRINEYEFGGRDLATMGRPHLADALIRLGAVRNFRAAFDEYIGESGRVYVPLTLPRGEEVIRVIREAGGVASLAHPVRLGCRSSLELRTLVKRLRDAGLGALEVWHPSHTDARVREFRELCGALDLCPTGGSDFHRLPPKFERGVGFGRVRVAYSHLETLRASLKNRAG